LVKTFQARGDIESAIGRLNRVLGPEEIATIEPALRLRFLWLRGELALAAGRPAEAMVFAENLETFIGGLPADAVPEADRRRVAGAARLLGVEALLGSRSGAEGREALEKLRADYPDSDAAHQSYLIEARQWAEQGDAEQAERVLMQLVEVAPGSEYTVQALYEAAVLAERRGSEADLQQATERLERLARHPAAGELLFHARMRQGDILRKRDRIEAAREVYQSLRNEPRFAGHPNRHAADVSFADTLLAQAQGAGGDAATAISLLERVFDLAEVPADLRMEAAAKLSAALVSRDRTERAEETFLAAWTRFGRDPSLLGPSGRFWLGRMLLSWAEWQERRGRAAEARVLYERLAGLDIPGRSVAQARLQRIVLPDAGVR
jgi:tetratricopeptide (TPR) repeat protein